MDKEQPSPSRARRRFLSTGASALAGGLVAGAAYSTAAANQSKPSTALALPWPWRALDPMEAGSRAYRYYLDLGG
jgi:hypothetical protein